jgi:hypothetical protein
VNCARPGLDCQKRETPSWYALAQVSLEAVEHHGVVGERLGHRPVVVQADAAGRTGLEMLEDQRQRDVRERAGREEAQLVLVEVAHAGSDSTLVSPTPGSTCTPRCA